MTYDPAQPINLIFNSINDLVEYDLSAESELTQSQTINLDLAISHKKRISKTTSLRGNAPLRGTKIGKISITTSEKLTLSSERPAEKSTKAIVDQIMERLRINKDKHTATATQHATKLASAN